MKRAKWRQSPGVCHRSSTGNDLLKFPVGRVCMRGRHGSEGSMKSVHTANVKSLAGSSLFALDVGLLKKTRSSRWREGVWKWGLGLEWFSAG